MPKGKRTPYPTEIAAFAGFDGRGNIALGTLRLDRDACQAEIERVAPAVKGYPAPLRILPVYIGTDLNRQLDMPLESPQERAGRVSGGQATEPPAKP